ncbi:MAG: hypothetical protein WD669_01655 [Pirellulales bacterium]
MRRSVIAFFFVFASLLLWSVDSRAAVETKFPDIGNFYIPLSPNGGTYVYANSFVAPISGIVTELGMWLDDNGSGGSSIRFQVLDSLGGNPLSGPDTSAVLATTAVLGPFTGSLALYTAPETGSSASLIGGQTYWFAGNVVGLTGPGHYQVGGHTPGFGGSDPGTFWYSNDPTGAIYDGQNLTPEMAFTLTIAGGSVVPEASGLVVWSLLVCISGGAWWMRRRSA